VEFTTLFVSRTLHLVPESPATGETKMVLRKKRKVMPYAEAIKSASFKNALAKSIKANPERKTCKAGHNLVHASKGHIHVGDLLRTGYRNCRTCWAKQQAAYEAKLAKARKVVAK
jgi:hypothetical protein